MSYRKISWSLEAVRFRFRSFNRSDNWQTPREQFCRDPCQISERYDHYNTQISRLWDLTRFDGKTSYSVENRGPGASLLTCFIKENSIDKYLQSLFSMGCNCSSMRFRQKAIKVRAWVSNYTPWVDIDVITYPIQHMLALSTSIVNMQRVLGLDHSHTETIWENSGK